MGHTLQEWRTKVAALLREVARSDGRDVAPAQLDTVGIVPALAEHSGNRPLITVIESAGNGTATYDVPAGWIPFWSRLLAVEFPARQNPPVMLDDQSWQMIRKVGAIGTEQILLDRAASAQQYLRFSYTTPWPTPVLDDATVDLLDDLAYEAVAALAASRVVTSLAVSSARNAYGGEDNVAAALITAAKTYRGVYLRHIGLAEDGQSARDTGPASRTLDLDPQYWSLFHGGRR